MIVRTFKKSYLQQYIFLVLIAIVLWGGAFISPPVPGSAGNRFLNPGWSLLAGWLGDNPYLLVFLAFLLMLAAAMLFNVTLEKSGLAGTNSLVPALVFVLIMSIFPSLQTLHQAMIPGFLSIVVLLYIFNIYIEEQAYPKVFNSGFFIALSSFFYFPSIVFLLFVWFTFVIYRLNHWREYVIILFGFLTPYVLLWTLFFWNDELRFAFEAYGAYFTPKSLISYTPGITLLNYFPLGIAVLLFFRGFLLQAVAMQENVISVRKYFWVVILFFIISMASFLFSGNLAQYHVIFIQVSFALVIQGLMFNLNRYFFTELMVWLMFVLIVVNNYLVAFQII